MALAFGLGGRVVAVRTLEAAYTKGERAKYDAPRLPNRPAGQGTDIRSGHPDRKANTMTIPDIGHCAGSGAEPAQDSIQDTGEGASIGVCPACSGRFQLHSSGVMALHDAA